MCNVFRTQGSTGHISRTLKCGGYQGCASCINKRESSRLFGTIVLGSEARACFSSLLKNGLSPVLKAHVTGNNGECKCILVLWKVLGIVQVGVRPECNHPDRTGVLHTLLCASGGLYGWKGNIDVVALSQHLIVG